MLSQVHLAKAQDIANDLVLSDGLEVENWYIKETVLDYAELEELDAENAEDMVELVIRLVRGAWVSEINFPPVDATYKKVRKARGN